MCILSGSILLIPIRLYLSHLYLSHLYLSHLYLSYPILAFPILAFPILSFPILPHPIHLSICLSIYLFIYLSIYHLTFLSVMDGAWCIACTYRSTLRPKRVKTATKWNLVAEPPRFQLTRLCFAHAIALHYELLILAIYDTLHHEPAAAAGNILEYLNVIGLGTPWTIRR